MENQEQFMQIKPFHDFQDQKQIFENQSVEVQKFVHAESSQDHKDSGSYQKKKVKQSESWKNTEQFQFLVFMIWFKKQFTNYSVNSIGRKIASNRFELMNKFIKTKTVRQCSDHYSNLLKKWQTYDAIISHLQHKVFPKKKQSTFLLSEIKKFYKKAYFQDINKTFNDNESNSLQKINLIITNSKIEQNKPLTNFEKKLSFNYLWLKKDIIVDLTLSSAPSNHGDSENSEDHQLMELQPDNQGKALAQGKNDRNFRDQQMDQSLFSFPNSEQQNQANNSSAFTGTKNNNKIKSIINKSGIQSSTKNYFGYRKQLSLRKFRAMQKPQEEKRKLWTFYEKYKFALFFAMHKDLSSFNQLFNSVSFFCKLQKFIGTKKTAYLCQRHLQDMLKKYERNRKKFVEQEMKIYKILPQFAQRKRLIELSRQSQYFSIGNLWFHVTNRQIHKFIDTNTYEKILKSGKVDQMSIDYSFEFNNLRQAFISEKVKSIPIKFITKQCQKDTLSQRQMDQNKSNETFFQEDEEKNANENVSRITLKQVVKESDFMELKKAFQIQDKTRNQGIYVEKIRNVSEINLRFEITQSIRLINKQ